jgi:hypothetical protein
VDGKVSSYPVEAAETLKKKTVNEKYNGLCNLITNQNHVQRNLLSFILKIRFWWFRQKEAIKSNNK